jgi:hypothetical protein
MVDKKIVLYNYIGSGRYRIFYKLRMLSNLAQPYDEPRWAADTCSPCTQLLMHRLSYGRSSRYSKRIAPALVCGFDGKGETGLVVQAQLPRGHDLCLQV